MEMIIKLKWYWASYFARKTDNRHYVRDAPGDTHGTEELRPMIRWRGDPDNFFKHWQ